jgi:hypothetical protein
MFHSLFIFKKLLKNWSIEKKLPLKSANNKPDDKYHKARFFKLTTKRR